MKSKLLLASIVALAAVLGCDTTTDYAIEHRPVDRRALREVQSNEGTGTAVEAANPTEEQSAHCWITNLYPVAPFTVSYLQNGISIDPDNHGNVGLRPEPFDIIFTFDCGKNCEELYPIARQTFQLQTREDINFFKPNDQYGITSIGYIAFSFPETLLVHSEREVFNLSYQFLGEEMVCQEQGTRKRCRIGVNSFSTNSPRNMGELNGQTLAIAYAPHTGCEGILIENMVRNYLVFEKRFTYEY